MKFKTLLVLLFIHSYVFSQIKIQLTISHDHLDDYNYDYIFSKKSDSTYLKVYHSDDMGHPYARGYELKKDLPSGVYEVYINEIINSKVILDISKKTMIKTLFNAKGIIKEIQYYENEEFRKQDIYNELGNFDYSVDRK